MWLWYGNKLRDQRNKIKSPETFHKYIRIYFTVQIIFQISGEKNILLYIPLVATSSPFSQKLWKPTLYLTLWMDYVVSRWVKDQIYNKWIIKVLEFIKISNCIVTGLEGISKCDTKEENRVKASWILTYWNSPWTDLQGKQFPKLVFS